MTRKVIDTLDGRMIETKAGSGNYVTLGTHGVFEWKQGGDYSLTDVLRHFKDERSADRFANKNEMHVVKTLKYVR